MKRIISFLLTTLLILGSVVLPAAAEEVSYPDFQFAVSLGFIDAETLLPDQAITRAQLAQVFHNIMFYGNGAEGAIVYDKKEESYNFDDVAEEQKDAVKLVSDMGIMTGFPDGTFRPDATVTYHQLIKTFVSFLGYDAPAQELGGWTVGYLTQANRMGILPGGNIAGDAVATCGAVGQMLKLATGVDIMLTTNGIAKVLNGVNYLEHWCGISMVRGEVTGNYLTNIASDEPVSYFGIYLDDIFMAVDKAAAGIQDKIGYTVAVYYKEINGTKTIVGYEEESNNNILEIDAVEIVSATTSQISYTKNDGDSINKAALAKNAVVIYNGSYLASFTDEDLNPFTTDAMDGMVRLIDNDNNGAYDVVVVESYDILVVSGSRNDKIFNTYKPQEVVDLTDYEERNINIINIMGEPVTPDRIQPGHTMNVCKDKDGNVKSLMVFSDQLTGVLENYRSDGNRVTHITVNGNEFEVLSRAVIYNDGRELMVGNNITLYFSRKGEVAYIDGISTFNESWKKGVLIDLVGQGNFVEKVTSLVFTTESKVETIAFPKKLEINGVSTNCDERNLLSAFGFDGNNKVNRQAFLYKVNETGDTYTSIYIADKSGTFSDGFYQFPKGSGDEGEYAFQGRMQSFDSLFAYDQNSIIFSMPSEKNRHKYEDYEITALADSTTEVMLKADCYGTKKEGMVADIVLIDASAKASESSYKNPIFMVTDVQETKNEYRESIVQVSGLYVQGTTAKEGAFEIKKDLMLQKFGSIPNNGDIYRIPPFETTGKIEVFGNQTYDYLKVFDFKTRTFNDGGANPLEDGVHIYQYGKVTDRSGDLIKIQHYTQARTSAVVLPTAASFKIFQVKTNHKGEFVSAMQANANCIIADNDYPGEGSDVIVYDRGTGIAIFVIN